jgi:hypothetical protein
VANWPRRHLVIDIAIMAFYISVRCGRLGLFFGQWGPFLQSLEEFHNRRDNARCPARKHHPTSKDGITTSLMLHKVIHGLPSPASNRFQSTILCRKLCGQPEEEKQPCGMA